MQSIDNSQQQNLPETCSGFFIIRLNIVDCLTLSGVLLVCISIALMLSGRFELALSLLYLAVIADAFDGVLARKLKIEREFGRYLDGFVDCLDYLVAPALFLFLWGFNEWYHGVILITFIMSGIIRLSVFNQVGNISSEDDNGLSYWGAPVFWSVLVLGPVYLLGWFVEKNTLFVLFSIVIPLYSIAMLHNGRYYKFKNPAVMLIGLSSFSLVLFVLGYRPLLLHIVSAFYAIFPLALAGCLHMVLVKKYWFSLLAKPIHNNWFGASKTWRGVLFMPIFTIVGFYILELIFDTQNSYITFNLSQYSSLQMGLLLGLAYILSELPNSFMKRRLGISPGKTPKKRAMLFVLGDQLDSIVGCGILYMWWLGMPWQTFVVLLLLGILVALLIKRLLFKFGLKSTQT